MRQNTLAMVILAVVAAFAVIGAVLTLSSPGPTAGRVIEPVPLLPDTIIIRDLDIGEFIANEVPTLTQAHLRSLASGTISTPAARSRYDQFLRFGRDDPKGFNGGRVAFLQTNGVGDYLTFQDAVIEYSIQFNPSLQSRIDDDDTAFNLLDRQLVLLGRPYVFVDAEARKNGPNPLVRLSMFGPQGRLDLQDSNTLDAQAERGVRVNGQAVPVLVQIDASISGDLLMIRQITYRILADPNPEVIQIPFIAVPAKFGVREFLRYPSAMFPGMDIIYGGARSTGYTTATTTPTAIAGGQVAFVPRGRGYTLRFVNNLGRTYEVELVDVVGGTLVFGREGRRLIFSESGGFFVRPRDRIVITDRLDVTGVTAILEYRGVTGNIAFFTDLAGGDVTASIDSGTGQGTMNYLGVPISVAVDPSDPTNIAIDLNRDGVVGSGATQIVLNGGPRLQLVNPALLRFIVPARLFESQTSDETTNINFILQGSRTIVSAPNQATLETFLDQKDNLEKGLTPYGAMFIKEARDPGKLLIIYPTRQAEPIVRVGQQPVISRGRGAQAAVIITLERERLIKPK